MKKLLILLVLLNLFQLSVDQNPKVYSMLNVLQTAPHDTSKVNTLNDLQTSSFIPNLKKRMNMPIKP
jgi:hypothetical protein